MAYPGYPTGLLSPVFSSTFLLSSVLQDRLHSVGTHSREWRIQTSFFADSSLTAGSSVESSATPQKLLILDARSYTAAVANRAKGGGCECEGTHFIEHYSPCLDPKDT